MKLSTAVAATVAILSFNASSATLTFQTTPFFGAYHYLKFYDDGSHSEIIRAKANEECAFLFTNTKGKEKRSSKLDTTLQMHFQGDATYECGANIDEYRMTSRSWDRIGNIEGDEIPFTLPLANNGTVHGAVLLHQNLKQEIGGNKKGYSRPQLYVNIDGKLIPAKNSGLGLPSFVKGSGQYLFDVMATGVSPDGKVIVGYMKAKQDIPFNGGDQYYLAKGEKLPLYWTLKAESKPSCNSKCKKNEEAHVSVSQAKILASGNRRSNIKYAFEGEKIDWFDVNEGLSQIYGITMSEGNYYIYGSALVPAGQGDKFYEPKIKKTPAMMVKLEL